MGNAGIFELAYNMQKTIHLRELIDHHSRQTGTTRTAIEASNVGIGDLGTHDLLGVIDLAELIHPRIRHIHHGSVNFHLTGGHVRRDVSARKCFVESSFA